MNVIKNIQRLIKPPDEPITQPPVASLKENTKKKVLIIEDDKLLSQAMIVKLQNAGYFTVHAENGEEGLKLTQAEKPDMILLDLYMPVMDGTTFLAKLRAIPEFKILPVIVLTNLGSVENEKVTKSYFDADEFVIKSNVSLDEVVEKVQKLIG